MAHTVDNTLLEGLRSGKALKLRQLIYLTIQLSVPAIMAQISSVLMQYIDASMVGQLGAGDSASIGLMSSTTWLLGGVCSAAGVGFTVQVAHMVGAREEEKARSLVRIGLLCAVLFSMVLASMAASLSKILPVWLGGETEILRNARLYILVFSLTLPVQQINNVAGGMLQSSGNMKTPSILHVVMCGLDVVFNALLIFPTRTVAFWGLEFVMPGAGLGVLGAALGTSAAQLVTACVMLWCLLVRSPVLHLRKGEKLTFEREYLRTALRIALPVCVEEIIRCGAQIGFTKIVSPLGTTAIAAHSFSITAESLCYMPGYGIGMAATALIGQSIGARRADLTRKIGWIITGLGMAVMAGTGVLMYIFAPWMIGFLSPDAQIRALGTRILRIEAFAEPMYAASIVASGVFRGAGDTLWSTILNFVSMWFVRLPLAAFLAPRFGLEGVWIAMCLELCVRGILFLARLSGKAWQRSRVLKEANA